MEWPQHFHNIKVYHLVDTTSDHSPLLLAETSTISHRRKRRFHFEAMWIRRADCKDVIEEIWNDGSSRSTPNGLAKGLIHLAPLMHNYHCSYLHLLPSFLLDPFSIPDKKGESII